MGVSVLLPTAVTVLKALKPTRVVHVVVPLLIQKPNAFPILFKTQCINTMIEVLV